MYNGWIGNCRVVGNVNLTGDYKIYGIQHMNTQIFLIIGMAYSVLTVPDKFICIQLLLITDLERQMLNELELVKYVIPVFLNYTRLWKGRWLHILSQLLY